jgi:Fe-S oxidoreductase
VKSVKEHRRKIAYCTYCPKMCRFSCPVSNADMKETHTPWGKQTSAFQQMTGERAYDADSGAAPYACTGCQHCRTYCKHENEVGLALFSARAEVVEEGQAPTSIDKLRARFASSGNPYGVDLGERVRAFSREPQGRLYFPGCTALAREPSMVQSAIDAAAGFGVRLTLAPAAARCCGYPLWAAGLAKELEANAQAFVKEVKSAPELVLGDPGCAVMLQQGFQELEIELRPKIVLLVDLLAERLEYAFGRAPLPMSVSYHDACLLGRTLGRFEGPRRLLRAAVGDFHEALENRLDGGCSGGGGLLPLTMPEAAAHIARAEAVEHQTPGRRIVTGCPSACRNFRKAGVEAVDLFTVLARWIAARENDGKPGFGP